MICPSVRATFKLVSKGEFTYHTSNIKSGLVFVKERKNGVPMDRIEKSIFLIRGQKVILDKDLAELYGVQTKQLKRAVRRNINRFPIDFMFELSREELKNLRSHFGTSRWGGTRYRPMAFTEQGVAMLGEAALGGVQGRTFCPACG
jgi:hypothetical protein